MATRQIKMPRKGDLENEIDGVPSQRKRPESGRYSLQVDRQTKGSYLTAEAAQSGRWSSRRVIQSSNGIRPCR
jgi:hypothetical protein